MAIYTQLAVATFPILIAAIWQNSAPWRQAEAEVEG
jgi:hypothetical protein